MEHLIHVHYLFGVKTTVVATYSLEYALSKATLQPSLST